MGQNGRQKNQGQKKKKKKKGIAREINKAKIEE